MCFIINAQLEKGGAWRQFPTVPGGVHDHPVCSGDTGHQYLAVPGGVPAPRVQDPAPDLPCPAPHC